MSRIFMLVFVMSLLLYGRDTDRETQNTGVRSNDTEVESGYRIDEPGTITFTVGVKIKGKVEKPQVMIFLPKEQPVYKEFELNYSFEEEIKQPLSFTPVTR